LKSISLALVLCISGVLCAQTATPPEAPAPQAQQDDQKPKRSVRRGVTSFWPAVSAASTAGKLTPGEKFRLFGFNTMNPFPVATAAARAGFSQAIDSNEGFGQGGEGYAKRFGAAMADTASTQFFGTFLYPVILKQDPRYFRKGEGSTGSRIGYALSRTFVTRTDSGHSAPNVSFFLASTSAAALSMTYYPAGDRSAGDAAVRFGTLYASQAGFNLFKEYWPDIKHKLFGKDQK
jgi:hypothetical protein